MNPVTIIIWPENYLEAPGQPISTQVVRRPEVWEENLTLEDLRILLAYVKAPRDWSHVHVEDELDRLAGRAAARLGWVLGALDK